MAKRYRITVFGKVGCDKCKVLQQRIDQVLAKDDWSDFEKLYCDVEQEEGLVEFCRTECVNPARIPAFVVARLNEDSGRYEPLPNPRPEVEDTRCGASKLYSRLGLQTDYSETGRGVITPKMITAILEEARAAD